MRSMAKELGNVSFPKFTGERVYMHPFFKQDGLPAHLKRWQSTVDGMLEDIETDGPIYIMIDQKVVSASSTHRRGGMHIDGYWIPDMKCHGGGYWDRSVEGVSRHNTQGGGRHSTHCTSSTNWPDETIILASDVMACKGLIGEFTGNIGEGGDCSHLDLSNLSEFIMQPNKVYAGNVTFLHESIPVAQDCLRTLVRLNVPGHKLH